MEFRKASYQHVKGSSFSLECNNDTSDSISFLFSFEDLKEPVFIDSYGIQSSESTFAGRIILLNPDNKAVVLLDTLKSGFIPDVNRLSFFGSYLLTPLTKIVVEVAAEQRTFVSVPYANHFFGLNRRDFDFSESFSSLLKKTFITVPAGNKILLPIKDFDHLGVSLSSSAEGSKEISLNGVDYYFGNATYLFIELFFDSLVYEFENKTGVDVCLHLYKQVFNTETFFSYQYYLNMCILHLSLSLKSNYHNTMSKIYSGTFPDVHLLVNQRDLLLRSDFNEANKGYYDDYDFNSESKGSSIDERVS